MRNVIVIGAQWGDEGKGKIVDWLCDRADIVIRFQGGHNAGHTLVIDGTKHRLHMLPSGVVRSNVLSMIGPGTVIEPWCLLEEIRQFNEKGIPISPQNLMVAENACLVLPHYAVLDTAREKRFGKNQLGTTRRGIGVAYEDKAGRRAIRLCDLEEPQWLRQRVEILSGHHNPLLEALGAEPIDPKSLSQTLLEEVAPRLLPFSQPIWEKLRQAMRNRRCALFEGAQGVMLDVDHGTYPFVTSSNTVAAQASVGSGLGFHQSPYVLGITKCYTTRVGSGPFPSEQDNDTGKRLGEIGNEFGTTTQRRRRCGWFDAVLVRQSCAIGGIDGMALTKLDVLDHFDTVRICTGYRLDGKVIDYLPACAAKQDRLEPVYEDMPGWRDSTQHARSWRDLPAAAIKYIRRIEELAQTNVALVSTSPERNDTITVDDPFDKV